MPALNADLWSLHKLAYVIQQQANIKISWTFQQLLEDLDFADFADDIVLLAQRNKDL